MASSVGDGLVGCKIKYVNKLRLQRILILGGTSGIGFCVAEAALEHGATVIISGSNNEKLEKALTRLRMAYPLLSSKMMGFTCDLSKPAQLEENLLKLLKRVTDLPTSNGAKLDHVVVTAGDALQMTPLTEVTVDYIQRAGTVRFLGSAILGKLLPPFMMPGPCSSLTLTGGSNTTKPEPGWSIMAGWGGAVEGLMRGLAVDLQPLRVNMVSPGAVHTELFNNFGAERLDEVLTSFRHNSLTGTVAKPEEVAEAYLYIMKDWGVTGSIIDTNSGRLLK